MYQEEYRRKLLTASAAAETIRNGEAVLLPGGAITPVEFGNALPQLIGRRRDIRLMTYLPLADLAIYKAENAGETFAMEAPFYNRFLQTFPQPDDLFRPLTKENSIVCQSQSVFSTDH